jgi:hypothetical protein
MDHAERDSRRRSKDEPAGTTPADRVDWLERLAELVMHLTDCAPEVALHAVNRVITAEPTTVDEALRVVARAICGVKRGLDLRDVHRVDLREPASTVLPPV